APRASAAAARPARPRSILLAPAWRRSPRIADGRPMTRPASRRAGAVDPFIVMDVMAAAAEKEAAGDTVVHLEVGQPSTPAPKEALVAAHTALDSDRIGYVAALGLPAL